MRAISTIDVGAAGTGTDFSGNANQQLSDYLRVAAESFKQPQADGSTGFVASQTETNQERGNWCVVERCTEYMRPAAEGRSLPARRRWVGSKNGSD